MALCKACQHALATAGCVAGMGCMVAGFALRNPALMQVGASICIAFPVLVLVAFFIRAACGRRLADRREAEAEVVIIGLSLILATGSGLFFVGMRNGEDAMMIVGATLCGLPPAFVVAAVLATAARQRQPVLAVEVALVMYLPPPVPVGVVIVGGGGV